MLGLPPIGLGTWQLVGRQAVDTVRRAIELGYRHIDTAAAYDNESAVGAGIRAAGIAREELTLVTKFPEELAGAELAVLRRSLDALGVDYLDLWLLHGPAGHPDKSAAIWQHFIEAKAAGLVREIGVSNFTIAQIDQLYERTAAMPAVNQIAFGPYYFEAALQPDHDARGVTVVAHSPFNENKLDDDILTATARRHQCEVHQVILSWHASHGVPVVAKSTDPQRLTLNLHGADLALLPNEVTAIDAIGIS